MATIDWNKLHRATSTSNEPTPGWLFNDIVRDVSHAPPREIPAVAEYLADCVDGDHAHVKLKALFVIKSLAYRVPPFCTCMRSRLDVVREAASFTGPPSALFGDEPYRLVREAAEETLAALTGGEYYHEQYREMSQRIIGFGNYLPDEDTVLPDGSINVTRDVSYRDITATTVGFITGGVGTVLGAVKDVLISPFMSKPAIQSDFDDGVPVAVDVDDAGPIVGPCDLDGAPRRSEAEVEVAEEEDEDGSGGLDEHGCYHPSPGNYIPPALPALVVEDAAACAEAAAAGVVRGEGDDEDDVYCPWRDGDSTRVRPPPWPIERCRVAAGVEEGSLLAMLQQSAARAAVAGCDSAGFDLGGNDAVYEPWHAAGGASGAAAVGVASLMGSSDDPCVCAAIGPDDAGRCGHGGNDAVDGCDDFGRGYDVIGGGNCSGRDVLNILGGGNDVIGSGHDPFGGRGGLAFLGGPGALGALDNQDGGNSGRGPCEVSETAMFDFLGPRPADSSAWGADLGPAAPPTPPLGTAPEPGRPRLLGLGACCDGGGRGIGGPTAASAASAAALSQVRAARAPEERALV